jgi:GNAT superfamily N-acetyltransferase
MPGHGSRPERAGGVGVPPPAGTEIENMRHGSFAIRPALAGDLPGLLAMQARSFRQLGRELYTPREIDAFLAEIGTMDPFLVEDGSYWLAEREGRILVSGGWSMRPPGYAACEACAAGPAAEAPPPASVPTVRSIFVDPDHARGGLGRAIMAWIEADIAKRGFARAQLTATLMGVPFYAALGYRAGRPRVMALSGGMVRFIGLLMDKALPEARLRAG